MTSQYQSTDEKRQKRNKVTLYDAVAGRAGYEGFLSEQAPSKHRDTASSTSKPVPPEEVLFRRKGAPVRYEEDDIYFADRHLQPHQRLPDSDLLKAIHAYAADFYGTIAGQDDASFKSLDETALLALGILIEEAASEAVGKTGDPLLDGPTGSESSHDEDDDSGGSSHESTG